MIGKIMGSGVSKTMIKNVISDIQTRRPASRFVDYSVELTEGKRVSKLYTNDDEGKLRNYSRILLGKIIADIGNKSGRIAIQKKPLLMSCKKAAKKVEEFLEKIQPQKLFKANDIKISGGRIGTIDSSDSFEFMKFRKESFDGYEVSRTASMGTGGRIPSSSDNL